MNPSRREQDIPLVHKSPISPVLTHHSKFYTGSSSSGRLRAVTVPRPRPSGPTFGHESKQGRKGLYIITSHELESQPERNAQFLRSYCLRWLLTIYKYLCISVFSICLWNVAGQPRNTRKDAPGKLDSKLERCWLTIWQS